MSNAIRDQNHVTSKLAVLNTDTVQGTHKVNIAIDGSNKLMTSESATISFTMVPVDARDENYVNCWLFEGSDGLTYPAVATSTGQILIDT